MNKLMAPRIGLTPNATIDPKSLQTVLDLRAHFGPTVLGAPEKYLDLYNYNVVMDSQNA